MAEGTYEYECMRAELLGIEKPDYEEFMKKQGELKKEVEEEEVDIENAKEVDLESEAIGRVSGKLEELNNILKKTQSKISKMKVSCGSVAGIIRNRIGSFSSQTSVDVEAEGDDKSTKIVENHKEPNTNGTEQADPKSFHDVNRKSELARALDKDLSCLDDMINNAETAQISMEYQRKEMKKFLDKM